VIIVIITFTVIVSKVVVLLEFITFKKAYSIVAVKEDSIVAVRRLFGFQWLDFHIFQLYLPRNLFYHIFLLFQLMFLLLMKIFIQLIS